MPKYDSPYLQHLIEELAVATSTEENDQIWQRVETPIIEDVPNQPEQCLVTFLYREEAIKKQFICGLHLLDYLVLCKVNLKLFQTLILDT